MSTIPNPLPGTTREYTKWAYVLIRREADGENIPEISKRAWREVLGYAKDADAQSALDVIQESRS